ncbi:hypothetical protein Hanom_Chr10g00912281 [Helianthus anomalus]
MQQYTSIIFRLYGHLILWIMCRKMVFLIESGIGLMYFRMKDFQPSVCMGAVIVNYFASALNFEEINRTINSFASVLKFEEVNRTKGTNMHLFCYTGCFVSIICTLFIKVSNIYIQIHIDIMLYFLYT